MTIVSAIADPQPSLSGLQIVVVEDDHRLREDLTAFFSWRGATTSGCASAEAFWAGLDATSPPDLALLDLGLPGESGLAMAARLRQALPDTGIVMLTAFGTDADRIAGLDQGADAYLVKGQSLQVLEATCRSVLRRLARLAHARAARAATQAHEPVRPWSLDVLQARLRMPSGHEVRLTHLEQIFLAALMHEPGVAVSRTELLARMGRPESLEQLRNLDGCAARLRRKLQELGAEELPVRSYYGHGYAFGAPATVQGT